MLLQYQPNTCHLSIRPLRKSIQPWQGNELLWQWHVLDWPLNQRWFGGKLVFRLSKGWSTPVSLMGIVIVKLTHPIARDLEGIEVWAGRGATFGAGVTALFVAFLPAARSRAPTVLCRGGYDCWVMTTPSIPQGVCSLHHGCSRLVGASSYCFSHGRRQVDKKKNMERKRSLSGETPGGRCCLSFPMRTLGLRPCISMGSRSNSK
jgi:hypothetical protein